MLLPWRHSSARILGVGMLLVLPRAWAHDGTTHPVMLGIDQNQNSLSDLYESQYPGLTSATADQDGDGQTNAEENAAGTNPLNGADRLEFSVVEPTIAGLNTLWPTQPGKEYQVQTNNSLGSDWVNEGPAVIGDGAPLSCLCTRTGPIRFIRLLVRDVDSDADGVTDWEERKGGTDPLLPDTDGDGRSDMERITSQLLLTNRINVSAAISSGTEAGSNPIVFRFTRSGNLNALSVSYATGGTATSGRDYPAPSGTVTFPFGATTATVTLPPTADGLPEPAETIILTVNPGTGYTVGSINSASATIEDFRYGLLGKYFNTQETTYPIYPATNANFDPAQLKLSRIDGPVDFNWGAGPPPGTGLTNPDAWSIRWEGQLLPPATGKYILHVQADRGAVLSVNGTTVISQWGGTITSPLTEYSSSTALANSTLNFTAGTPVNFRLDHRESATTPDSSSVRFFWTLPDGTKTLVPFRSLICDPHAPAASGAPVLSAPPYAFALRGGPFSYQIPARPAAFAWAADQLPGGLSIDSDTGLISGTTHAPAGLVMATVTGSNASGSATIMVPILILESGGALSREVWTGLSGSGLGSIPLSTPPSASTLLSSLEAPSNDGDQFGDRLRGYLTAPTSGNYTFFLTADETAEFWLSSSEEPGHRLKRSWVANRGSAPGTWSSLPGQKSLQVRLAAGQRYYIEAIRRETTGSDHLAIGWLRPGQSGTEPAGVVPGWALSPYLPPAATVPDGTLYIASLTPQAGAATLGAGSAVLFVNAAKTDAELTFTYSNLTGPIISQHLHDSRPGPGPTGAIIFDIDDETPDAAGVRHWHFTATGNHTTADVLAAVESGTCYINLHTNSFPNGEIKGFFQPATGSQFFTPPAAPPAAELTLPADPTVKKQDIVRFLQQATLGGHPDADGFGTVSTAPFGGFDPGSIESVAARGYSQWLEDQLALDPGTDPETVVLQNLIPGTLYDVVTNGRRLPNALATFYNGSGPLSSFLRTYYERYPRSGADPNGQSSESATDLWRTWWRSALTARDQVRHRMAYALSQIMVVSEDGPLDERSRAVAQYYDLLYYHGLGNFRTLLEKVTLNPAMGKYLDMLGNKKPDATSGSIPNENYAREILQLFSIGLKRLHPDGSLVLDINGLPLATYGQDNVVGYAHTFTGWSYGTGGNANFVSPMAVNPSNHATGEKLLLENAVLPANASPTAATCDAELQASHDVIFHHPNAGPFICRQLIQRMVTANPSPGYLYRCASAFDDNGSGVRGDMKAVMRAILLDPEARNQTPRLQPGFGKLKEPVLRATQMLRAFQAFSFAASTWGNSIDLGAAVFSPQGNLNLAVPLRTASVTYGTTSQVTITTSWMDDAIDPDGTAAASAPAVFSFPLAPGNLILLRRQTAPPAGGLVINAAGDTNSPQNGLYVFTANGVPLARAPVADTPAELNKAWIMLATARRDAPGTPGGSPLPNINGGVLLGNRYYQQTSSVTNLGTDPVLWTLSTSGAGNTHRRLWEMGNLRSPFQQNPLRSPTVFNFYEPDYMFLGQTGNAGLTGPEFQITSETTVITTANWFYDLTRRNSANTSSPFSYGQGYSYGDDNKKEIKLNLTRERPMAANAGTLVDHLATLLMPGQMTPRLRSLLTGYLTTITATTDADKMNRLGEALYLISLCPEFAIQR